MKKVAVMLMVVMLGVASQADVLVYEGFGDATDNRSINAYQSTTAGYSQGISGAWSELNNNGATLKHRTSSYGWDGAQTNLAAIGSSYSLKNGDAFNFMECNSWGLERAQTALAAPIDLTVDGTLYMSFVASAGIFDYAAQMGLNDGTNELMWGNGYTGGTQGLAAHYGLMSDYANGGSIKGTSGVSPTMAAGWDVMLYVAQLQQVVGTGLTVNIYAYDLNTTSGLPTSAGTPLWSTTLTGVTGTFTNLQLDLSGSGMYPSIDELRIGQSWADVTGGNVNLIAPSPSGAQYIPIDTNLQWSVINGWNVDVYMSGPYNEPNAAPVLSLVDPNNGSGLYNPSSDLAYNKWYYWRVDELEPNIPSPIVHTGMVWSFKTVGQDPVLNAVTPALITVDGDGTQSAVFSVTGANIIGYQWYKISSPDIQLTESAKYAGVTTDSLTINTVDLADEGYYYCVVSNGVSPNTTSNRDTGSGLLMTKRLIIHYPLDTKTTVDGNDFTPDVVGGFDMKLASDVSQDGDGTDYPVIVTDDPNVQIGGGAMLFDNSDSADPNNHWGQYLTAGDVDLEAMGNGFTVELWMKRGALTGTVGLVVRRNIWASGQMMWGVEVQPGGGLYFASGNGWTATVPTVQDEWTHVAVTHNGVSTARVYANGEFEVQATNVPYWGGVDSPLMLAASDYNAATGRASNFFNGVIDDVKIYNYIRTTGEIALDYLDYAPGGVTWVCDNEGLDLVYDYDGDCEVGLGDFLLIAEDWLNSNRIY
jgi:hypothetical protein